MNHFPLRKLISRKAWKSWAIGSWSLIAGGLMLWSCARLVGTTELAGPRFAQLFDPLVGRMIPFYQAVLLGISGQLALLVFWARSRSEDDFHGRYRVWTWWSAACFIFAFCIVTGAHAVWGEAVTRLRPFENPRAATLAWLLPAFAAGYVIFRGVWAEMVENRAGLALLMLAGICWLAAGAECMGWLAMAIEQVPDAAWAARIVRHPLLPPGLLIAANGFVLMAMLLHARYVIHLNAEPPLRRPSLLRRLLRVVRRDSRTPATTSTAETSSEIASEQVEDSAQVAESGAVAESASKDAKASKTKKPLIRAARKTPSAEPEAHPTPEESTASATPARKSTLGRLFGLFGTSSNESDAMQDEAADVAAEKQSPASSSKSSAEKEVRKTKSDSRSAPMASKSEKAVPEQVADESFRTDSEDMKDDSPPSNESKRAGKKTRVDPPPDPQSLKGLSKRERRLVRKQWREQQRAQQAGEEI